MRITCPSCKAQYDVDPSMIPEAGRDVQCSNCAHTWFVKRTDEETAAAPEADERLPEEVEAEEAAGHGAEESEVWAEIAAAHSDEAPGDSDAAEHETTASGEADGETPEDEGADLDDRLRAAIDNSYGNLDERDEGEALRGSVREAVAEPSLEASEPAEDETEARDEGGETKPALDDEVAGILREEAEFEATRRRGEEPPPAFEPQGDLGLDEDRPSQILRERLDRMRGDGVPEPTIASTVATATSRAAAPEESGPRRERLPDIEEINSSLRPGETDEDDELPMSLAEVAATRRSGFRTGFAAVVLLVAVLIGAYVYAPQIIRAVPGAESAMITYVDIANSVRDRIDGMMAKAISGLNGLTGGGSNGA